MTDTDSLVPDDEPEEAAASAPVETAPAGGSAVAKLGSGAAPANAVTEAAQTTDGSVAGQSTGLSDSSRGLQSGQARRRTVRCRRRRPAFKASDAIGVLMAYSAKVRIDQIGSNDTTDTLTNGVSSRRNQLLMDISSELGVASVDGAAEATLDKLAQSSTRPPRTTSRSVPCSPRRCATACARCSVPPASSSSTSATA